MSIRFHSMNVITIGCILSLVLCWSSLELTVMCCGLQTKSSTVGIFVSDWCALKIMWHEINPWVLILIHIGRQSKRWNRIIHRASIGWKGNRLFQTSYFVKSVGLGIIRMFVIIRMSVHYYLPDCASPIWTEFVGVGQESQVFNCHMCRQ